MRQLQWFTLLIIISLSGCFDAYAQPGDLDTTCGVNGIVTMNMFTNGSSESEDYIRSVTVAPDNGPIYIGGESSDPYLSSYSTGFLAARLNSDGSPDTTFGTDGRVLVHIGSWMDGANDLILTPSGILLAGYTASIFESDIALIRLNSDGTLDNTFGIGGKVVLHLEQIGVATAVAVQADGKILVVGNEQTASGSPIQPVVIRLLADGSPDASFGNGGVLSFQFGGNPSSSSVTALATHVDSSGQTDKIIVGGYANYGGTDYFAVSRLNMDGTFDTTFNGSGTSVLPGDVITGGGNARVTSLQVNNDDSLIAAGSVDNSGGGFSTVIAVRYNLDGSMDTGFGNNGVLVATYTSPAGAAANLAGENTEDLTMVVTSTDADNGQYAFAATRFFLASGMIDDRFGWIGNAFVPFNVIPGYAYIFANTSSVYQWTIGYTYNGVVYPGLDRVLAAGQSVINNSTDLVMAAISAGDCQ